MEEFGRVLQEELGLDPTSGVEEVWSTFKGTLKVAQESLPLVIRREETDWVNDEVKEVSRMKQKA